MLEDTHVSVLSIDIDSLVTEYSHHVRVATCSSDYESSDSFSLIDPQTDQFHICIKYIHTYIHSYVNKNIRLNINSKETIIVFIMYVWQGNYATE